MATHINAQAGADGPWPPGWTHAFNWSSTVAGLNAHLNAHVLGWRSDGFVHGSTMSGFHPPAARTEERRDGL
jgi:hypothetical protein